MTLDLFVIARPLGRSNLFRLIQRNYSLYSRTIRLNIYCLQWPTRL